MLQKLFLKYEIIIYNYHILFKVTNILYFFKKGFNIPKGLSKDTSYNGLSKKGKTKNKDLHKTTQETKYGATRVPTKTGITVKPFVLKYALN